MNGDGLPIGFSSVEEWETWKADLHSSEDRLRRCAERLERRQEELAADAARNLGGGILGTALPGEVRDALATAKRIESFLHLLPDAEIPTWAAKLASILSLVARALGV